MSLIIEGIEMPKDGRLLISIHSDGCVYRSVYDMGFEKVNCAKAKELPPHGDLIDRDQMVERAKEDWIYDLSDLPEFASYLPVVIAKEETNNDI